MKLLLLLSAAATLGLVSCSSTGSGVGGAGVNAYRAYDLPASRPNNPSAVRVKVSLKNQAAYVMEGSRPLLVMPISVGTSSKPTPTGTFRIFSKQAKRRANTHGYAYNGNAVKKTYLSKKPAGWSFKGTPMPYWCEFKSAYGFHTGWMKPYPCTHGCIRMHENVAPKFFKLVRVGTPVSIRHTQPEDATVGRNIPRPPDAGPLPDYPPQFYLGDGYFSNHKPAKLQ
ncbi:MAG: L,D-transpeptidase [Akkermansiaceae bacterium]|nr:L,D-transpeptidase [Akkermansiaceae bacterium]